MTSLHPLHCCHSEKKKRISGTYQTKRSVATTPVTITVVPISDHPIRNWVERWPVSRYAERTRMHSVDVHHVTCIGRQCLDAFTWRNQRTFGSEAFSGNVVLVRAGRETDQNAVGKDGHVALNCTTVNDIMKGIGSMDALVIEWTTHRDCDGHRSGRPASSC